MRVEVKSRKYYIYFIRHGIWGPVKIGRSSIPLQRISQLQTATPTALTFAGLLEAKNGRTEKSLHRRFQGSRLNGEWFARTPDLASYLEKHVEESAANLGAVNG